MPIAVLQTVSLQTEITIVVVLVLLGCTLTYLALRSAVSRELEELRANLEELKRATPASFPDFAEKPKALAAAAGAARGAVRTTDPPHAPAPNVNSVSTEQSTAVESTEAPSEEVLVLIAAAVAAFFGKRARVRHTRLVHPEGVSPWAQQGRVFVQASHNLGVSHHG